MEKLKPTIANLKKEARKGIETEPYAEYVIRPISIYFTWLIVRTPISANTVTVFQILVGVLGALLLAVPNIDGYAPIYGVILLQFSYVLDCVDGEVARWKKIESIRGVYLDIICHIIVISMFIFCFSFGIYVTIGSSGIIILGAIASFFSYKFDEYAFIKVSTNRDEKESLYNSSLVKLLAFYRFPALMNYISIVIFTDYYIFGEYGFISVVFLCSLCIVLFFGRVLQLIKRFNQLS